MPSPYPRLDQRLVELGLATSRGRARALIEAGLVSVAGQKASKAAQPVAPEDEITLSGAGLGWVSRAALKLAHGLDVFGLSPQGIALDVGASTGGFTEVLLARGAAHVHALDVGHGQLHPRLSADPRVTNHEGINARAIPAGLIPDVDWIVSDVSFISLTKALPGPLALAKPGAKLVALIKPQFELGPQATSRGVVKDPSAREAARGIIREFLGNAGWRVTGETESPITGKDGNREYLIAAEASG